MGKDEEDFGEIEDGLAPYFLCDDLDWLLAPLFMDVTLFGVILVFASAFWAEVISISETLGVVALVFVRGGDSKLIGSSYSSKAI